jgi:hypothetical protein
MALLNLDIRTPVACIYAIQLRIGGLSSFADIRNRVACVCAKGLPKSVHCIAYTTQNKVVMYAINC